MKLLVLSVGGQSLSLRGDEKPLSELILDILFEEKAFEDNPLTEQILTDRLSRGRGQIRDALNRLQVEGLIERRKKKGVYIISPTPTLVGQIYDVRLLIERYAVRRAVATASDDELNELQKIADRHSEAQKRRDFTALEQANTDFHEALISLSRNDVLIHMMVQMNIVRKAFRHAYGLQPNSQRMGSGFSHQKIVDALRDRNAMKAEDRIQQHIQVGKEHVIEQALGFRLRSV